MGSAPKQARYEQEVPWIERLETEQRLFEINERIAAMPLDPSWTMPPSLRYQRDSRADATAEPVSEAAASRSMTQRGTRNVATQSQTTYTYLRGYSRPMFLCLPAEAQGACVD